MTDESPIELISRREYARRKGFVPSAVMELCAAGKLTTWVPCPRCQTVVRVRDEACDCGEAIAGAIDPRKGQIIPSLADQEMARHADPSRQYLRVRWAEHRGAELTEQLPLAPSALPPPSSAAATMSFAEARAARAVIEAKSAELDFRKRAGELVEAAVVQAAAARQARTTRDALQGIPDRLAQLLAAEPDRSRVHALLSQEIERVLLNLANGTTESVHNEPS